MLLNKQGQEISKTTISVAKSVYKQISKFHNKIDRAQDKIDKEEKRLEERIENEKTKSLNRTVGFYEEIEDTKNQISKIEESINDILGVGDFYPILFPDEEVAPLEVVNNTDNEVEEAVNLNGTTELINEVQEEEVTEEDIVEQEEPQDEEPNEDEEEDIFGW